MACARLPSTTSVMVSRILKWLPSHIRLEKYMVRDWARLGSTVEKKKKLRRWFKREGESDEKKKGKGEKKKICTTLLQQSLAAALDGLMPRDWTTLPLKGRKTRDWKLARDLGTFCSRARLCNLGVEKCVFVFFVCLFVYLFSFMGNRVCKALSRHLFCRYPELSLLGLDRLRIE